MQSMILPLLSSDSSFLTHFASEFDFLILSFASSSSTFSPSAWLHSLANLASTRSAIVREVILTAPVDTDTAHTYKSVNHAHLAGKSSRVALQQDHCISIKPNSRIGINSTPCFRTSARHSWQYFTQSAQLLSR